MTITAMCIICDQKFSHAVEPRWIGYLAWTHQCLIGPSWLWYSVKDDGETTRVLRPVPVIRGKPKHAHGPPIHMAHPGTAVISW